ncbi:hypothetical protein SCLCIDRAFT_643647 [Scleroderma citrinum Foug A]|uniref:Uncharacterized protein n=1 Tax=Scleroderma citrinum Foug A TaxID=1036808 RepID=A0A0C3AHA8_9AGAM|nr:hypothetical protein SCLCIDRAFT_643647 [Scleroderma citrinum Foug A]
MSYWCPSLRRSRQASYTQSPSSAPRLFREHSILVSQTSPVENTSIASEPIPNYTAPYILRLCLPNLQTPPFTVTLKYPSIERLVIVLLVPCSAILHQFHVSPVVHKSSWNGHSGNPMGHACSKYHLWIHVFWDSALPMV